MVNDKKRRKKRAGGKKKSMTADQTMAYKAVNEWVYLDSSSQNETASSVDDFSVSAQIGAGRKAERMVFEFHSHSKCSDGYLSPSKLVERASGNGVRVLALTDHDTMSGIPEAIEAGNRFGVKIIPGVEISTIYCSREPGSEEPVHVLAYYSSCGPAKYDELESFLANIRDGRFQRAKNMISKLNKLKIPLRWESVAKIAGKDTAPGRLHIARALHEAGYVENLRQAFTRYLYDGGPAYSTGNEPSAEEAVRLICQTGGVAVLAHPWALKNPAPIIRRLKDAGLHGMEVYRSDGKLKAFSELAETYGLLNLGGADYHGRGGRNESELGTVNLPVQVLQDFLKLARPIWCNAIKSVLETYIDNPSDSNLANITRYGKGGTLKGKSYSGLVDRCLSLWLSSEERRNPEFDSIRLKLSELAVDSSVL